MFKRFNNAVTRDTATVETLPIPHDRRNPGKITTFVEPDQGMPPDEFPPGFWQIDESKVRYPQLDVSCELAMDTFFNATHFVKMNGKNGPLHTHPYRLQVRCRSKRFDGSTPAQQEHKSMVIPYHALREHLHIVIKAYNNKVLNDLPPFQNLQATTENFAAVLFQQFARLESTLAFELVSITLWESPTESITYRHG